ncbi:MAG: iron ABC transporter permease, partial [Treponema sp.]|nr:iron ABC transporter permease [Treponema sp.]
QLTGWTNAGTSSVLGLILLLPSMFLFFLQNRLFNSQTKKIAVIGGKGNTVSGDSAFKNSKTVDILLFIFLSITALCILLQFISIIAGSFQKLWGIDTHFTFNHIKKTFRYTKDFGNTLLFALTGSVLSGLLGAFVSFCVHRTNFPFKNFTDTLIQLPSAVPGTLLGLSYSVTSNILNVHFPRLMITAVITISFIPFSYRMITSAFSKIKFTLDEGALSLGRGPLKIFSRILVPLCKEGIFGGWTYNFARGVGTLSPVIFLVSFNTPLCSVRILNLAEQGDWGRAAALALELTIITFIIIGFGKYLQKNPFSKNQHLMGKIYE